MDESAYYFAQGRFWMICYGNIFLVPALVDLISIQLAVHPDAPVERIIFGSVDAVGIASSLSLWCQDVLGAEIAGSWLWAVSVGCVAGLELADGRRVVVKAYAPDRDRARLDAVLAAQASAIEAGLPAARPLSVPTRLGLGWAVAEEAIDVGRPPDMRRPEERLVAARGWMRLVEILSREAPSLFGSALDVRGSARVVDGLYPVPHSPLFDFNATGDGAEWIDDIARTAWRTLQDLQAPARIVHMDWRPDNFRVNDVGDELVAIYDWDSLRVEPEASALGQVAAMHSIDWSLPSGPHFADAAGCVAFAVDAEKARSRPFSDKEWSVIRAAIAYGWCYTARCEHARAYVGDDKPQFQMRHRLRVDGRSLLGVTSAEA